MPYSFQEVNNHIYLNHNKSSRTDSTHVDILGIRDKVRTITAASTTSRADDMTATT